MSVTLKRVGEVLAVLQGVRSLLEEQEVDLFTVLDLENLDRERRVVVDLQMPSFLRGDEDEDVEGLFHQ